MSIKILHFEDKEYIGKMYQVQFEEMGFECSLHTRIPKENDSLFKIIKDEEPDLILMDMVIPDIDGKEATRKLKSFKDTKEIPIFGLSNIGDDEDIKEVLGLGMADYFLAADITPKELALRLISYMKDPDNYDPRRHK